MTHKMLSAIAVLPLTALLMVPSSAATENCEQVYQNCQRQLKTHASCAQQHPENLVADAAAVFEIEHRLETADSVATFAPDPSTKKHLRQVLDGLLHTSDAALKTPGFVETVLIDDLHYRHAQRIDRLLSQPRSCDAASLKRLERSCRAGSGEVRALTQGGDWPTSVATCMAK